MKYEIIGNIMPVVEVTFENTHESMITQSGGMSWMDEGVSMETNMKGGFLKSVSRAFAGESMFIVTYSTSKPNTKIAFSSTVPGEIMPIRIEDHNGIILQKGAFLCAESTVEPSVIFNKKLSSGLFGGEGFILQKLNGKGIAFLEIDGNAVVKELKPGETILVDTGNIVAFDGNVKYDIQSIKGAKNILFGGEGLFVTKLTGPGSVILQTQNFADFAGRIITLMPSKN